VIPSSSSVVVVKLRVNPDASPCSSEPLSKNRDRISLAAHFRNYSRTENNGKGGRSTCPTAATTLKHDEWEGREREKALFECRGCSCGAKRRSNAQDVVD